MSEPSETPATGWVAGIVAHGSYDELPACLAALAAQSLPPAGVLVTDTGLDPARLDEIAAAHPGIAFETRANTGWGGGGNRVFAWANERHPAAAFVLLLNSDVELAPDFARVLCEALASQPRVAIASGKLVRPDGTIDSAGIRLPRHRRPRDRGSEEPDRGAYDRAELVFGVAGAAMWLRRSAIADLAIDGEVIDEDFFTYHDDTDLCWRANLLGWQVLYEPRAIAVHGRRWRRERRFEIAPHVRRHSFKNHYLQMLKNERPGDFVRNLPWLLAWEVLRLGFALVRDPAILPAYAAAWRGAPAALRKRRVLQARVRAREASIRFPRRPAIPAR